MKVVPWLAKSRKVRALDYINVKNLIGKQLAWYDTPIQHQYCADGYALSRRNRSFYNIDVCTAKYLLVSDIISKSHRTIKFEQEEGDVIVTKELLPNGVEVIVHQYSERGEQRFEEYHRLVQAEMLRAYKQLNEKCSSVDSAYIDMGYSCGVGASLVLPLGKIEDQDQLDFYVDRFLDKETSFTRQKLFNINLDEEISYLEQTLKEKQA